jgi:hypothetical protein
LHRSFRNITVSPILKGRVIAIRVPDIIFDSVVWAARPTTMEAKPAATNRELAIPLVSGKAVKVVDAMPTKIITAIATRSRNLKVVLSFGSSFILMWE